MTAAATAAAASAAAARPRTRPQQVVRVLLIGGGAVLITGAIGAAVAGAFLLRAVLGPDGGFVFAVVALSVMLVASVTASVVARLG